MTNATLQLAPDLFSEFRDFIYKRCGIYFADAKQSQMEAHLSNRIAALALREAGAYLALLSRDARAAQEIVCLLDEITLKEPAFFQHEPQLEMFRSSLLPAAMERRAKAGQNVLRLWSAGCSSGEEPYTLAILLREALGARGADWQPAVVACDISARSLDLAQAGRYAGAAIQDASPSLRARYFKPVAGGLFEVDADAKALVHFERANLLDKAFLPRVADTDILFCRNVLAYFDAAARRRAVESLHGALCIGGYLVVGPMESLHGISSGFKMIHHNQAVVYQKQ